jgi:Cof subfamily protein (haloacid dehalogenase superfamily)
MKIRLVSYDCDGTAYLNASHEVLPSTMKALHMLKQRGVKLLLNTGRAVREMERLPKEFLDLADMISADGGARIQVGNEVSRKILDPASAYAGMKLMAEHNIVCRWVDVKDQCCLTRWDKDVSDLFYRLYLMRPEVRPWNGEELVQITYYCDVQNLLDEIDDIFSGAVHTHLHIAHEQTAEGTGKDAAVRYACTYFNIPKEETAAIGDGGNDISMLEAAGYGIAMGNGSEQVKSHADYVTRRIEEDGFYDAVCHLLEDN